MLSGKIFLRDTAGSPGKGDLSLAAWQKEVPMIYLETESECNLRANLCSIF